jgi:transposase
MTMLETRPVTGGVDTHLDIHVAAALDANGGLLGVESFATTPEGFTALYRWLASFGPVVRVRVKGPAPMARAWHGICAARGSR